MQLTVNGQDRQCADGLTVAALLAELAIEPQRCAVELNEELVPRARHGETVLQDADRLEIVTLVGGG